MDCDVARMTAPHSLHLKLKKLIPRIAFLSSETTFEQVVRETDLLQLGQSILTPNKFTSLA